MKFITVLFSAALIAGAAAQTTTTTSSAPVNTNSSYGAEVDKCLSTCKPEDTDYVNCTANCLGNPNPTSEQVIENTKCSMACPQGNGTQADTEAYGKCLRECTVKYFLPNPSSVPSSGPSQTDGSSAPTATDSNGNRINSTSTSTSTSSSSSTSTNGASAMVYSASFAGVVAAFAAFLAL
ncbi:hypothetical protein L211DRAFT_846699 [Terfezia boudieri ATCC MYA-4762]|uniref:Uncharacterized protein n=1 Tax=Terfezia boudieri ATCC MYA-4762 TaxID=1051890 RepID=A0A3N4LW71_9PEZI|nr:hypothetical protein L211DRAFT_846699 [Terfezia boudieri ATCC MYA-4762]